MNELKILVVDDESRMRKLVKDFLTRAGYQVLEAQDGEEAVDTFYSTKGINLLVLDVMMPKMDGWEVVKEFQTIQPKDLGCQSGSNFKKNGSDRR